MSVYQNDARVKELTSDLIASGSKVFQIFQNGNEKDHVQFLLRAFNPPAGTVLDVGCGIGEVARLMKEERPDLDFILLNRSKSQLEMCPDFQKLEGVAEDIPLPDESVDSVMACYVLGHTDIDKALSEMWRVLKTGGVLFIYDLYGDEYLEGLDYYPHQFKGWHPEGLHTNLCQRLGFDFEKRFPDVKPVIVRRVK